MTTVKIGKRDLDVADCTLGLWDRLCEYQQSPEKDARKNLTQIVGFMHELVGHNDGVTVAWLKDHLGMRTVHVKFREVLDASGLSQPKDDPTGEAGPQ